MSLFNNYELHNFEEEMGLNEITRSWCDINSEFKKLQNQIGDSEFKNLLRLFYSEDRESYILSREIIKTMTSLTDLEIIYWDSFQPWPFRKALFEWRNTEDTTQ